MCHKIFFNDNFKIKWPYDACLEVNYIMHSSRGKPQDRIGSSLVVSIAFI